jgi:hypothetical protein
MVLPTGTYRDSEPLDPGPSPARLRSLRRDPLVGAFVVASSPTRLLESGSGLDTVDCVSVIGRSDPVKLSRCLQVLIRQTRAAIVVSSDNHLLLKALRSVEPARLIMVGVGVEDPEVDRHVQRGGSAVVRRYSAGQQCEELVFVVAGVETTRVSTAHLRGERDKRVEARAHAFALSQVAAQPVWTTTTLH